jgi:hypothetical protein
LHAFLLRTARLNIGFCRHLAIGYTDAYARKKESSEYGSRQFEPDVDGLGIRARPSNLTVFGFRLSQAI